jgi:hypothetical protein
MARLPDRERENLLNIGMPMKATHLLRELARSQMEIRTRAFLDFFPLTRAMRERTTEENTKKLLEGAIGWEQPTSETAEEARG